MYDDGNWFNYWKIYRFLLIYLYSTILLEKKVELSVRKALIKKTFER